jgi:hypothetical protein
MSLQEESSGVLLFKKTLLEQIIRENADDPRVEEPKRQLAIINEEIQRREENPPNLTVGLKTLKLDIERQ